MQLQESLQHPALLEVAKEVHVIDHHADKESDVGARPEDVTVQHVGSVSTIVTEMLRERSDDPRDQYGDDDGSSEFADLFQSASQSPIITRE